MASGNGLYPFSLRWDRCASHVVAHPTGYVPRVLRDRKRDAITKQEPCHGMCPWIEGFVTGLMRDVTRHL